MPRIVIVGVFERPRPKCKKDGDYNVTLSVTTDRAPVSLGELLAELAPFQGEPVTVTIETQQMTVDFDGPK